MSSSMSAGALDSPEQEDPHAVFRTVQRTGGSSLAVTLPKAWTEAQNIHTGSLVRLSALDEGRLELSPAGRTVREDKLRTLHIVASDCPPQLLSRLLVGAYITGQDHVLISSDKELPAEIRSEVDLIARRVLGMSLVEDEPNRLEVRVSLDPTKHQVPGLVDRVVRMIRLELELCRTALEKADPSFLGRISQLEDEIDRFYLLLARQILLASNDFQVAHEIGVPSHHFQLGYRVVVKMLEVTADLLTDVAHELEQDIAPGRDVVELLRALTELDSSLVRTMEAFRNVSAPCAHGALTEIEAWAARDAERSPSLIGRSLDKSGAARVQRILSSLRTAREMLTIVNEITINRAVEPETIAKGGHHAVIACCPHKLKGLAYGETREG